LNATIVDIKDETPWVRRFFLQTEQANEFEFKPGQFVAMNMPDGTQRSYSIASYANMRGRIELCIVLNSAGKLTPWLWTLKPGDVLSISGPMGNFVLNDMPNCDVAFICTGTGVAPFRSMIQQLLEDSAGRNIYLIFGCRNRADLLYRQEFESWQQADNRFRYIPVLSREQWEGRQGYVHAVYEELFADGRDARFYVCGWKVMCNEARTRLKQLGYNRRQYFFEEYDG
jgi:CDP-4-dehydro-6-deoxyglucose reductase